MATLVKEETTNQITYTGIGAMAGVKYVVQKSSPLDVHIVVPEVVDGILNAQSWQEFVADLDTHI